MRFLFIILFINILALVPQHAYAQTIETLKTDARALMKAGRYQEAAAVYEKALPMAERSFGANSFSTIVVANELANAYESTGNYKGAVKLYEQCIQAIESQRGPHDENLATLLNNLGVVYQNLADFPNAERCLKRSLEIGRLRFGANSKENASKLNNLANLYKETGDYHKAEPLYAEAVRLYETSNSDRLPIGLSNLAGLYREMGQFDKALPLYERALKTREQRLGANHPDVGSSLNSLGLVYLAKGNLDQAATSLKRSLKIREEALGADHLFVATTLNNLASVLERQKDYDTAEQLYQRCLRIREQQFGPDHPDLYSVQNNIAGLLQILGKAEEAEQLYLKTLSTLESQPKSNPAIVSMMRTNLAALQAGRQNWDSAAESFDKARRMVRSYVARVLPSLPEREQLSFLKARDSRAFHAALSLGLARKDDPQMVAKSAEWLLNGKAVTYEALAASAKGGAQTVEKADPWITLTTVRDALPQDGVMFEIVALPVRDFQAQDLDQRWQAMRYVGWVIPPSGKGEVKIVDLGPVAEIDHAVTVARTELTNSIKRLKEEGEPDAEKAALAALQPLSQQVLMPLLAATGEVQRLIVSPDSSLWLVPWSALPLDESTYAIEKYEFSHMISGRYAAVSRQDVPTGRPLIFADPDYDSDPMQLRPLLLSMLRGVLPKLKQFAPSVRLPQVERLMGTALEAAAISPKIAEFVGEEPVVYQQGYAQESVVKIVQQPSMLVICTHGFFMEQQVVDGEAEGNAISGLAATTKDGSRLENPLLRCGLMLAGCNKGTPGDDGILTGLEIVEANLQGTKLVVLSACETGLGTVRNGEGVSGLRQAFQLAGAQHVLSSLWSVDDRATAQLMSSFFGKLQETKQMSTALRESQLKMIDTRRFRTGSAHPFFWAAFNLTESCRTERAD